MLTPDLWREQVLGQAAARVLGSGQVELRELLLELLGVWPTTSRLELRASGDLASAVQLCPPARVLLLRVAIRGDRVARPLATRILILSDGSARGRSSRGWGEARGWNTPASGWSSRSLLGLSRVQQLGFARISATSAWCSGARCARP